MGKFLDLLFYFEHIPKFSGLVEMSSCTDLLREVCHDVLEGLLAQEVLAQLVLLGSHVLWERLCTAQHLIK